ncbi:MAG: DNA-binding protein [Acidilobaceae archaeon]|nr:DNA-binding protein [Acidilobaceae archaeon]
MRSFLLRVPKGAELISFLKDYAKKNEIKKAVVFAIGSFEEATLAYYDLESRKYEPIEVKERTELVSLSGNISLMDGEPFPHVHAVLSRRDGSTVGGHLLKATVFMVELYVSEVPGPLLERKPWEHGLRVWDAEG